MRIRKRSRQKEVCSEGIASRGQAGASTGVLRIIRKHELLPLVAWQAWESGLGVHETPFSPLSLQAFSTRPPGVSTHPSRDVCSSPCPPLRWSAGGEGVYSSWVRRREEGRRGAPTAERRQSREREPRERERESSTVGNLCRSGTLDSSKATPSRTSISNVPLETHRSSIFDSITKPCSCPAAVVLAPVLPSHKYALMNFPWALGCLDPGVRSAPPP